MPRPRIEPKVPCGTVRDSNLGPLCACCAIPTTLTTQPLRRTKVWSGNQADVLQSQNLPPCGSCNSDSQFSWSCPAGWDSNEVIEGTKVFNLGRRRGTDWDYTRPQQQCNAGPGLQCGDSRRDHLSGLGDSLELRCEVAGVFEEILL